MHDNSPHRKRSFWTLSLRELFLFVLASLALIGWWVNRLPRYHDSPILRNGQANIKEILNTVLKQHFSENPIYEISDGGSSGSRYWQEFNINYSMNQRTEARLYLLIHSLMQAQVHALKNRDYVVEGEIEVSEAIYHENTTISSIISYRSSNRQIGQIKIEGSYQEIRSDSNTDVVVLDPLPIEIEFLMIEYPDI
jgi:hypothetical protein